MELSGRLASVPLPDLLQWVENDRRTGCLVVRTSSRQKRVFFERGRIVGCYSDNPAEYFGQYLLLHGFLDHDEIRKALSYCRREGSRLGEAVVELGLLSESRVRDALRGQIVDAVCDLFLWNHGVFYLESHVPAEESIRPTPIETMAVAMEGSRWSDELDRIKTVFVHDNVILCRGENPDEGAATPLQERILEQFTDLISLGDLYNRVKGSHFRFLEAVFQLTVRGVLDIDSVGEETVGRVSKEIRIFDLLMEQAAEEEVVFSAHHLSLPLEVLERFFPVWIEPGKREEDDGEDERAFLEAMDGSSSLHELVLDDEESREEKMELILLELRRGNLALLPRPLDEFVDRSKRGRGAWLSRLFSREA